MTQPLNLLDPVDFNLRMARLAAALANDGTDCAVICDNADIYWLTGRVFSGYILIWTDGRIQYFVRRPNHLHDPQLIYIHKPEQITGYTGPLTGISVGMELSLLSVNDYRRLTKALGISDAKDITGALRQARSVKTPLEIGRIAESGRRQEAVYRRIPSLYRPGMTDVDLQIAIEGELRRDGCLGQFRISGSSMELFMANILAGDNADNPTPYDFAMGGAGADPSLPVGADGSVIKPGTTVMVDANGNFTGYMTDMTRTFRLGDIAPLAISAHRCSIDICRAVSESARPGAKAADLYALAHCMAKDAGLEDYFMGHRQKAGFVGHGVGIEINEAPVIAPRSRDIIAEGNVFALEPKFVIPGTGAVGIENTYAVIADRTVCLTNAPEDLEPFS